MFHTFMLFTECAHYAYHWRRSGTRLSTAVPCLSRPPADMLMHMATLILNQCVAIN